MGWWSGCRSHQLGVPRYLGRWYLGRYLGSRCRSAPPGSLRKDRAGADSSLTALAGANQRRVFHEANARLKWHQLDQTALSNLPCINGAIVPFEAFHHFLPSDCYKSVESQRSYLHWVNHRHPLPVLGVEPVPPCHAGMPRAAAPLLMTITFLIPPLRIWGGRSEMRKILPRTLVFNASWKFSASFCGSLAALCEPHSPGGRAVRV